MRAVVVAVLHALAVRLSEWIYDGDASVHHLPPWVDINESRVNLSYTLASRFEPTGTSSLRCDNLFVDLQGAEESYRILAVIFRGTTTAQDWIANAGALPDYDKFKDIGIGVHAGWKAVATYPEYVNRLRSTILEEASGTGLDTILFTGHSLGGAVAQVAALLAYTDDELWRHPKVSKLLSGLQCITVAAPQPFSPTIHQQIHRENRQEAAPGVLLAQANALQWMERRCTNYVRNNDIVPRLPGNVGFIQKMWDRVPFAVRTLLDLGAAPLPLDLGTLLKQDLGLGVYAPLCTTRLLMPGGGYENIGRTAAKRTLETHRPRDPSVSDTYLGLMEWNGFMAAQNEHRAKAYVNMVYRAMGARDYAHGHDDSFIEVAKPRTQYAGQQQGGQHHGQGRLTYTDSAGKQQYEGEFMEGKYHGHGRLIFSEANGNSVYVGEFESGRFHGQGELRHACGEQSRGQFKNGHLHDGHGIRILPDGTWFLGDIVEGKYHGEGWLKLPTSWEYQGTFEQGLFEGQGTKTLPDGEQYTGQFRQGKYHGVGRLILPTGAKYNGQFVKGEFHGEGH
ncbi:PIP5K1 [Symbiodinium sp. CCMP2456]|nr:PIP5K1 [Symbiodinium sp. CCMP2456]